MRRNDASFNCSNSRWRRIVAHDIVTDWFLFSGQILAEGCRHSPRTVGSSDRNPCSWHKHASTIRHRLDLFVYMSSSGSHTTQPLEHTHIHKHTLTHSHTHTHTHIHTHTHTHSHTHTYTHIHTHAHTHTYTHTYTHTHTHTHTHTVCVIKCEYFFA